MKLSQHDLTITCKLHAATRRQPIRKASKLSEAKLSFAAVFSMETSKSKHRALHGGAMPLLDHAGSFTLSLGHSTHTIPPGSGRVHPPCTELAYGPHGAAAQHTTWPPPRRSLYRRTDGSAGREPEMRDRAGWGSHGDGCRSRWRPYVNKSAPCR